MNREGFRAILLGGVLLAGVADAVVVKHPTERMLLGLVLLVAAALVLFAMRDSKQPQEVQERVAEPAASLPAVPEPAPLELAAPVAPPVPVSKFRKQLSLRDLLPMRRGSKLEAVLGELREQLELQQQLTAELRMKLGHHDGLRRAMWQTIDERFAALEAVQQNEVAALRAARDHHSAGIEKLQERLEAHKREVAALTDVLAESEPERPLPASVAS
jgi:hypothetical protein